MTYKLYNGFEGGNATAIRQKIYNFYSDCNQMPDNP